MKKILLSLAVVAFLSATTVPTVMATEVVKIEKGDKKKKKKKKKGCCAAEKSCSKGEKKSCGDKAEKKAEKKAE